MRDHTVILTTGAQLRPLRPDELAAIAGEIQGSEGRYPARRKRRR